jgi:hypothetical protein
MNPEGREYQGQYNDDGEQHGIGIYKSQPYLNPKTNLYEAYHIYAGQFNNNCAEGIGIKLYNTFNTNNELYCGEYKNNERNGIGYTKFPTGGIFIGEHKNHIIDGFGIFITWEKLKFIGHCYNKSPLIWCRNSTQSAGKWYDKNDNEIDIIKLGYTPTGCKYSKDTFARFECNGSKTWPSGAKYTGTMRSGRPHGLGTKIFEDENTYTGFWQNSVIEGQGTMTYRYGDTYVGEWKDGKRHGQGTFTSIDGRMFVGEFKENHEWNGNIYRK